MNVEHDQDRHERVRAACCDDSVIDPDQQAQVVERAVERYARLRAAFDRALNLTPAAKR